MYEIELKAHVLDRKSVIQNLEKFATFSGAVEKDDTYYSNKINGKSIKVRIRKETQFSTQEVPNAPQTTSQKSVIFTYKRKEILEKDGTTIEVNDEKELFLSDADAIEAFLFDTGFKTTLKSKKPCSAGTTTAQTWNSAMLQDSATFWKSKFFPKTTAKKPYLNRVKNF